MTTNWYSVSFVVDSIIPNRENPLNLQIGDKVLDGFFKVENIKTGNKLISQVYFDNDEVYEINYGTYGTITEFYDLSQISNGKYINILQNDGILAANNLIYFVDGQPYFTHFGVNININNNSNLYEKYLKSLTDYIKENKIEYKYENMQININIYQVSRLYIESSTTYTMDDYMIFLNGIYNPLDSTTFYIEIYNNITLKSNISEISGPPFLLNTIIPPLLYLKKYGDYSAYSRLRNLKNKNIYNIKKSYENGYYVKNTTEKNTVNNALSRTRAGGYIVPPKFTKRKSFF